MTEVVYGEDYVSQVHRLLIQRASEFANQYNIWPYSGLWILGKSFNTLKVRTNTRTQCGDLSCYGKSREAKQICKKSTRRITKDLFGMSANILIIIVFVGIIIVYTLFDVVIDVECQEGKNICDKKNNLVTNKTGILLLSIVLFCSPTFYLFANRFELKNFCLMNPNQRDY